MKKIYILLGHPDKETFSGCLADEYESGARQSKYEIRRANIGELNFDPVLHKGYKTIQHLEPDLMEIQSNFKWADHIVIVYPNWWITMPASLKGMFDRMFLPGFAFKFNKRTRKVERLLRGKSARVIVVSGTHHPWTIRIKFGDFTNEIRKGILGFAGINPVKVTCFGPTERTSVNKRNNWKKYVYNLGKKGI